MKRLLATVGLSYLSVLAVVFHFAYAVVFNLIIALSLLAVLVGIFIKIINRKIKAKKTIASLLITIGLTALTACIAITCYSAFVYQPIIDNYSDKEIKVEGYVCDEVQEYANCTVYTICCERINGVGTNTKLSIASSQDLGCREFERITAEIYAEKNENTYSKSKGVYLSSFFIFETDRITAADEKQFSLYSVAVNIRKSMKNSLDSILPKDTASLCKAILLGDKQALSSGVRDDFSKTGSTFLIVVSGMHLSVIAGFVLFLLKKFIKNRYAQAVIVFVIVFSFMAVTGFTSSVVRSGIMLILTYCASSVFRRADGINSLGLSAIILTAFNPFAVGDIGMLLSFSATAGIVLWAKKIEAYLKRKIPFAEKSPIIRYFANIVAVSLSASLWIIPITTIAFHKASPLVVLVSLFAEPIVSALLIFAMLTSLINLVPFLSFAAAIFAFFTNILGKLLIKIISLFAAVPYASVNSDKPYFYAWIVISAVLVIVGYAIKAKGRYVKCAVTASAVVLAVGWVIYVLTGYNSVTLKVYNVGSGATVSVENGNNISFLSCGGSLRNVYRLFGDDMESFSSIDSIIIPNSKIKYSKYIELLLAEFDESNVLVYDNNDGKLPKLNCDADVIKSFGSDCQFELRLNSLTTLDVININSVTYQYLDINGSTALFVPSKSDIAKLPDKYRKCDYLIVDSNVKNSNLLTCKNVIFSGDGELLNTRYSSIKEICSNIHSTSDGTVEVVFSGGSNGKNK